MGHGFHGDLRTSHIYSKNQPGRIEFFKFGVIHTKRYKKNSETIVLQKKGLQMSSH